MNIAINILKEAIEERRHDIAFYKNKKLKGVSFSDAYRHERIQDIDKQIVKIKHAIRVLEAQKGNL